MPSTQVRRASEHVRPCGNPLPHREKQRGEIEPPPILSRATVREIAELFQRGHQFLVGGFTGQPVRWT